MIFTCDMATLRHVTAPLRFAMMIQQRHHRAATLAGVSRLGANLVAAAGLAVLIGWQFEINSLMRIWPGFVAMNPMTAVAFVFAGASVLAYWQVHSHHVTNGSSLARGLGMAIGLFGVVKLVDCVFGWHSGVDCFLYGNRLVQDQSGIPNQMAPNTAFNFVLSGAAIVALNLDGKRAARCVEILGMVLFFNSMLALLGYVYGANSLYRIGSFIPMAVHTAGIFLILSVVLMLAKPERAPVSLFTMENLGGVIARRLLPVAILVPAILGAARIWGEGRGYYTKEFGTTIMVVCTIAVFTALIWWNAVLLSKADLRRQKAEAALKRSHDELELRVAARTKELTEANAALRLQITERQKAEQMADQHLAAKDRMEEQFMRAQRMESVGALASGIAHDMNNALAPIVMGVELIRSETGKTRRDQMLDMIAVSAERCSEMVKQILTFARGTRAASAAIDLPALLEEMGRIIRDTFPKSITLRKNWRSDLWTIGIDATELHQVLMNLCVNARDAMPEGGDLRIGAANMQLGEAEAHRLHAKAAAGSYVMISVADTGTGMSPETVKRIFEPFFTTKAPEKGTGLGLSTVATIVDQHKGFIHVDSEVGKGTEFQIYAPAIAVVKSLEQMPRGAIPIGRGELILLVDDEEAVAKLATTTLESYGYSVITASNGLEGIACFQNHRNEIKLIVTDSDMPFMDGMTAMRAIRRVTPDIPVIIASGNRSGTDVIKREEFKGVQTLSKPYGVEELLMRVGKALSEADQG